MKMSDAWRLAFPSESRTEVVQEILSTWALGCDKQPQKYSPRLREEILTEELWILLEKFKAASGLNGKWTYEDRDARVIKNGQVNRIRKDITYFSNRLEDANPGPLYLIFEFKKIAQRNLSPYKNEHGIRRFVDGYYATNLPVAFMVGMVLDDKQETVTSLIKSLDKPTTRKRLCMVPDEKSNYIRQSPDMDEVVEFETEHNRPIDLAPAGGTIVLGHCFINFPK
ncbi:hypothetical protein [Idiomarina sp. HP20-50]|uniref:hypothetical protein n=1 Tax=Idiomarina sp. HP20-50 TaxID=3070813 RepID=UPI00294B0931|nr:hypothetical protein [Idiomarina sp. HP20-50]MDV6316251.1 hypothetical protein [Idiomarina sp. HP20-50]